MSASIQQPNSPHQSVQIIVSKRDGHKVKTKILRHVGIALNEIELEKLKSFAYDIIATMKAEEKALKIIFILDNICL